MDNVHVPVLFSCFSLCLLLLLVPGDAINFAYGVALTLSHLRGENRDKKAPDAFLRKGA